MAIFKNTVISDTGSIILPSGTTAQRPASPTTGMIRYNSELGHVEVYDGIILQWRSIYDNYVTATGGEIQDFDVGGQAYRAHIFTSSGDFIVQKPGEIEVLLVGGGGGSGTYSGGGGGGEVVYIPSMNIAATTYPIVIGAGGIGNTTNNWELSKDGQSTTAFSQTAKPGGGGKGSDSTFPADNGVRTEVANGGGGSSRSAGYFGSVGTFTGGVTGLRFGGNRGGQLNRSTNDGVNFPSGGGGGAGQSVIINTFNNRGGSAGGDGVAIAILDKKYYWGGGGGGSTYYNNAGGSPGGNGGLGGGGAGGGRGAGAVGGVGYNNGGTTPASGEGQDGGLGTGGGGGGGTGEVGRKGGAGGSGIVIVRYKRNIDSTTPVTSIPTNNLQLHLDAGNPISYPGSGTTWFDISGNSRNGTLSGVTFGSEGFTESGFMEFTAQANSITFANYNIPNAKTLSFWMKSDRPLNDGDNWEIGFLTGPAVAGQRFGMMFGVGPTQDLGFWGLGSDFDFSIVNPSTKWIPLNQWVNVTLTQDSSNFVRIYRNGVQQTLSRNLDNLSRLTWAVNTTTNNFIINSVGAWTTGMTYVQLSQVLIYNVTLNDSQIKRIFNVTKGRYGVL
jgi:hypothetical protein